MVAREATVEPSRRRMGSDVVSKAVRRTAGQPKKRHGDENASEQKTRAWCDQDVTISHTVRGNDEYILVARRKYVVSGRNQAGARVF